MKFIKLLIVIATLALAVAIAAPNSYTLTLNDPAWAGSTLLKPGNYKIDVEGDKASIRLGKKVLAEVPVKVEKAEHKFENSSVLMHNVNNKPELQEIRIGGTTVRILLVNPANITE